MEQANPIDALFERASANRIPMSEICQRAGIAQTTPSRWRKGRNGATIGAVSKLNAALAEILAERPEAA